MKIAVVDDCREDALSLKQFLDRQEVKLYLDAEELLVDVKQKNVRYDLYFLDIYMKESADGIELAKELRSLDEEAVICFVSTSEEFYREAYDLYAVQYLIKPVQRKAVEQLLKKVENSFVRNKKQVLTFTWRKAAYSISYGKILYISSMGNTLSICCKDGTVQKSTGKLSDFECLVDRNVFCRCHQSFLVNMYQVDSIRGSDLMISDCRIPVSRRYYADVKKRYQEILFEEVE
ncbi:MAG: LytTR family DNA-binding domain-containing protein [Clostridium sp.]|nr:LytTR family DNA-binding domain-containing protein [Clostridium sp.]